MPIRAAIIGAGPAGLAAAHELIAQGAHVHVFERAREVGGLARSIQLWNESVDLGPHVMHGGDAAALALWRSVAGDMHHLPLRRAFWRKRRLISYPPSAIGLLRGLSPRELYRCGASYLARRLRPCATGADARSWFTARYGQPFYEVLLRGYLQKLWGDDGSGIDHSFVSGIVGTVTQAVESPSSRQVFAYPRSGLGAAWTRLRDRVLARGTLHLGSTVDRVVVGPRGVEGLVVDGREWPSDIIISTAPVSVLLDALAPTPAHVREAAASLHTRHMIVAHLLVESTLSLGHAWVFVEDYNLAVGRVSDSRFWKNERGRPRGILTLEYWCGDGDAIWTEPDAGIAARATEELLRSGLLPDAIVRAVSVTRLPRALPVPGVGYRRHREVIASHLRAIRGLHAVGRHGSFEFDSTLHSMAGGIAAARAAITQLTSGTSTLCDPAPAVLPV